MEEREEMSGPGMEEEGPSFPVEGVSPSGIGPSYDGSRRGVSWWWVCGLWGYAVQVEMRNGTQPHKNRRRKNGKDGVV